MARWLALGVFLNSLAQMAVNLVQGVGRPDLSAKLHFAELPFYLLTLWLMISRYGVEGAAIAWMIRIAIDGIILFAMAKYLLPMDLKYFKNIIFLIILTVGLIVMSLFISNIQVKFIFVLLSSILCLIYIWRTLLTPDDKFLITQLINKKLLFNSENG